MTAFRFAPGERERVDAAHERALLALEAAGLDLPTRGAMHAAFRAWLAPRIRAGTSRRLRADAVAALTLAWAREIGRLEMYALVPIAHAIAERHGPDGLARASAALPAIGEAHALRGGVAGARPVRRRPIRSGAATAEA